MRSDIEFLVDGSTVRGWLHLPEGAGPFPGVAMAHGFSGVKEMDLPRFAEGFAAGGIAALLFDYRGFGASDGLPRGRLDPMRQVEDYRCALTVLAGQPKVRAEALGVWGTSFSGAHTLHLAAFDPRVRAAVAQAPAIDVQANARRLMSPDQLSAVWSLLEASRRRTMAGEPPLTLPVVAPEGEPCFLPSAETREALLGQAASVAPNWRNALTADSFERIFEYRPARSIGLVAPKPLPMIVALADALTPPDLALAAFGAAGEPKRLVTLPGGHDAVYGDAFERCCAEAVDWFRVHLGADAVAAGAQAA